MPSIIRSRLVARLVVAVLGAAAFVTPASFAEELETLATQVKEVTIFRNLVAVHRSGVVDLEEATRRIVGVRLPAGAGVVRDSLRVTAEGAGIIEAVNFLEMSERPIQDSTLVDLRDRLMLARLEREAMEADLELFQSIAVRLVDRAAVEFGTLDFDIDIARRQLETLRLDRSAAMRTLLERTREVERLERAIDRIEKTEGAAEGRRADLMVVIELTAERPGAAEVVVRYQREDAGWRPVYSLRSTTNGEEGRLDYAADIVQATGEDWRNVRATLSTARPTAPRTPRPLRPVFIDRVRTAPDPDRPMMDSLADNVAGMGEVEKVGLSLEFELASPIDVPSDPEASMRASIASVATPIELVRVATPLVDQRVFVRADAMNESGFTIIPGDVALYFDEEYIGTSRLEEVPAGAAFEVWMGPDPSIRMQRLVLERETERTGLLGGGRQTSIEYRIDLEHLAPGSVMVEVWDRRPVSRDEDIEVGIISPTPALASDEDYLRSEARLGLLKWLVEIGPAGSETATREIAWTIRVNRSADIDVTPIPD